MFPRLNVLQEAAQEASQSNGADPTPAKKKTDIELVDLEDGTKGEFVGKRRLNKSYILNEDGSLNHCRFEFRNGRVLLISIPASLLGQFAGHGAIQKYGDELAGLTGVDESGKPVKGLEPDIDDMVLEIERLDESIQAGKWSTRKEGDGQGGTSVLIKALVIYGGKTIDQVKAFLKDKDAKFKAALRLDDKRVSKINGKTLAATIKEIEAAKAAKGPKVDTSSALDDLDALEGESAAAASAA